MRFVSHDKMNKIIDLKRNEKRRNFFQNSKKAESTIQWTMQKMTEKTITDDIIKKVIELKEIIHELKRYTF